MKSAPILVDIFGISGSGKSYFVEQAIAHSPTFINTEMAAFRGLVYHPDIRIPGKKLWQHIPIRLAYKLRMTRLTDIYIDQCLLLLTEPEEAQFLSYIMDRINASSLSKTQKHWLLYKFQVSIVHYHLARQTINAGKVVLGDEFLLQRCFAIVEKDSDYDEFVKMLPIIDRAVHLDTDTETCAQRIFTRSPEKTQQLRAHTPEETKSILEQSKKQVSLLTDAYQKQREHIISIINQDERQFEHMLKAI